MVRPGIVWGSSKSDPSQLVAQMSAMSEAYSEESLGRILEAMLQKAVEEVKQKINTRGVHEGVTFNGPRRKSDAMFDSVDYTLTVLSNGRIQGKFGYIKNAPEWALYQEYGTPQRAGNRGILEMLALTDTYRDFKIELEDTLRSSIRNMQQGSYTARPAYSSHRY